MDHNIFDDFSRRLASAPSRRALLQSFFGVTLTPLFSTVPALADDRASRKPRSRRSRSRTNPCGATCHPCDSARIASGADLRGCDLRDADLDKRDLSGADLRGACLHGAVLDGARLDGSRLSDACLAGARLPAASLAGCDLRGASFAGADLRRANLEGARLDRRQLDAALLCETRLPDGTISNRDLNTEKACGSCDLACASYETCCNGVCADLLIDVKHCTRCGNACPTAPDNAIVSCTDAPDDTGRLVRGCVFFCDLGWDDCDGEFKNGCETRIASDLANCGGCGQVCGENETCCGCECSAPPHTCGMCPMIRSGKLIRPR